MALLSDLKTSLEIIKKKITRHFDSISGTEVCMVYSQNWKQNHGAKCQRKGWGKLFGGERWKCMFSAIMGTSPGLQICNLAEILYEYAGYSDNLLKKPLCFSMLMYCLFMQHMIWINYFGNNAEKHINFYYNIWVIFQWNQTVWGRAGEKDDSSPKVKPFRDKVGFPHI